MRSALQPRACARSASCLWLAWLSRCSATWRGLDCRTYTNASRCTWAAVILGCATLGSAGLIAVLPAFRFSGHGPGDPGGDLATQLGQGARCAFALVGAEADPHLRAGH